MITQPIPKFKLGTVVATPGAIEALNHDKEKFDELIRRHQCGDWGEALCQEDKEANNLAIKSGDRILSAYFLDDENKTKIWIITEAGKREITTILLPSDY